jgi:hypothetical protein
MKGEKKEREVTLHSISIVLLNCIALALSVSFVDI